MSGQFRALKEDEIELRISTINEKGLTLLLYKTARTDANLLDEIYGPDKWQNDFRVIDDVLYGGIGIKTKDEWVWKWDAGVESYTEKEKGRASDAFKRAGFKHGIGRELYTSPFIYISADKCKIEQRKEKYVCYDTFVIEKIAYDDKSENITGLSIVNKSTGKRVFIWQEKPNA